jgi:hypothetical protein
MLKETFASVGSDHDVRFCVEQMSASAHFIILLLAACYVWPLNWELVLLDHLEAVAKFDIEWCTPLIEYERVHCYSSGIEHASLLN